MNRPVDRLYHAGMLDRYGGHDEEGYSATAEVLDLAALHEKDTVSFRPLPAMRTARFRLSKFVPY